MSKRKNDESSDINNNAKKSKKSSQNKENNSTQNSNDASQKFTNSQGKSSRSNSQSLNDSLTNSNSFPSSIPNAQIITDSQIAAINYEDIANKIFSDGEKGIFEKKKFTINKMEKLYSPIYNFFDLQTEYETKPTGFTRPKCILCRHEVKYHFGELSNLLHHLHSITDKHEKFKTWYPLYCASNATDAGFNKIFIFLHYIVNFTFILCIK
jgi:hypothetical protein